MDEIEQFFINYNKMRGRAFNPIARHGAAEGLVKRSTAKVTKKNRSRQRRSTSSSESEGNGPTTSR